MDQPPWKRFGGAETAGTFVELFNRFAHSAGPYCAPLSTGRVVLGGAELQGRRLFLSNCLRHIRHRAWVGALRLRGRSLGSRGMPLEGFLETLGSRFGVVLGSLGVSFGHLGASWGLLGASWGFLEASWRGRLGFSVRGLHLGPLLGPSWAVLGWSWGPLGPSWSVGKAKRRER